MKTEPILVHGVCPTPDDVYLRRLIDFFGLSCRTVDPSTFEVELDRAADHDLCVLASAGAITAWCGDNAHAHGAINRLRQKAAFLFVYGFAPDNNTASLATSLADEQISEVRAFDQARLNYEVAASKPEFTFDFSGLLFGPVHNHTDFAFACSCTSGGLIPLVSIAGLPFWALSQKDGCSTFLLACNDIVDLDETTEGTLDTGRYFSRLFPAAMFLKSVFKERCWHTRHRFANFIFDDPLLKNSYGYLNYKSLLAMMDNCGFASTIAFIPWNYRRTDKSVAQLFRERTDKLSICVHGCDHTDGEFAATDLGTLNGITHLASRRMNSHRARTGIMHSEVMVFPQGRFSPEALNVLKSNNYGAAVNSTAVAYTADADHDLRVRDLLDLAVTGYGGFPLFLRRYPGALEHLASDLFFGKPLFAVEHHAYLKEGGRRMLEFIARMNSLGALEWRGLKEIMAKSYLQRDVSDHVVACMLYTNDQVIENESAHERTFLLTKSESDNVPIESVCINGRPIDFQICDKYVQFAAILPAHASAKVDILYRNGFPCAPVKRGFRKASRVWTRRVLSEFRDNILCKSDLLFPKVQAVSHLLRRDRENARERRKLNAVTAEESSRSE